MSQKNCAIPITPQIVVNQNSVPSQDAASSQQLTEMKLVELKRLYDANLITNEVYTGRQKEILEGQKK
jgi:hypothetical protein